MNRLPKRALTGLKILRKGQIYSLNLLPSQPRVVQQLDAPRRECSSSSSCPLHLRVASARAVRPVDPDGPRLGSAPGS